MSAGGILAMDWREALFLHWPVAPQALRPLIPPDLSLDVFDGTAWIGIVAFRIARTRLRGIPAGLGFPPFGEVNVRTYVDGGKPGVWFFSLDAASALAVEIGRRAIHLPYTRARIATQWTDDACGYRSERTDGRAPAARLAAQALSRGGERTAPAGSLEHHLIERYCFYTVDGRGRTVRGDVAHEPWPLRDATATVTENTLLAAYGVADPARPALAHTARIVSVRARRLTVR